MEPLAESGKIEQVRNVWKIRLFGLRSSARATWKTLINWPAPLPKRTTLRKPREVIRTESHPADPWLYVGTKGMRVASCDIFAVCQTALNLLGSSKPDNVLVRAPCLHAHLAQSDYYLLWSESLRRAEQNMRGIPSSS